MAKATLSDLRLLDRAGFLREVAGAEDDLSYLVLFETGGPDEAATRAALVAAGQAHPERIRVYRAAFADIQPEFAKMETERKDIDTFNFRRAPIVGLYRQGRLVTTFNPRRVFYIPKQQAREIHEQLAIFLNKMVFFDPGKVREQVNLEVAEKKPEHKPAAAGKAPAAGVARAKAAGAAGGAAAPAKAAAAAGAPAGRGGAPSAPPAAASGADAPGAPASATAPAGEAGDTGRPPAKGTDGSGAAPADATKAEDGPGGRGEL